MPISRRQLLGGMVGGMVGAGLAGSLGRASAAGSKTRGAGTCATGSKLTDIEHVVILIQENRSFDHYFGAYRGVRGFNDRPPGSLGSFSQHWPGHGRLLPFRFDTQNGPGACTNDITHEWTAQHQSWNGGRQDQFVKAHVEADGADLGLATMGYYTRADLPFLYSLADAFTLCDGYHCSMFGPTYPNRLFSMTGTIDPAGLAGGPVVTNPGAGLADFTGLYSWTTMPERLQKQGVSWKVYSQAGTNNNMLGLFKQYRDPTSLLALSGLVPTWPGSFELDVVAGTLPQVSWVLAPMFFDEHPPAPSAIGEWVTSRVLSTLVSNPDVWSKTVLFVTYDENGGFFDHVAPPVASPGTKGEYLSVATLPPEAGGVRGPIGLGFRVPCLVVSPFSRGGLVCSDTFDHTSLLRFIETRFGVEVPNLSAWRRSVTGDLTSALNLAGPVDPSVPALPQPTLADPAMLEECVPSMVDGTIATSPPYPVPARQMMPGQERGVARRNARCT